MEKQQPIINWLPQQWAKPNGLSETERMRLHGQALNRMVREIHRATVKAGHWDELHKGGPEPLSVEAVLLQCVSDLALAAGEGACTRMQSGLPGRAMMEQLQSCQRQAAFPSAASDSAARA